MGPLLECCHHVSFLVWIVDRCYKRSQLIFRDMLFLDISKSLTEPPVDMIYGAVRFHLTISPVIIESIRVLFNSIIRWEE